MHFGLEWIRRRQRTLARVALGLFCAAWLQAAIVPCVMAHGAAPASPSEPLYTDVHQHHDGARAGHDHDAPPVDHAAGASHPCLYCPPDAAASGDCGSHGGCAYPHDPQVDARAAGAILLAIPVASAPVAPAATPVSHRTNLAVPQAVPKVSLAVSYCRFLE